MGQSTSPWAWVSPLSQFFLLHVPPVAVVLPKMAFFSLFAGGGGGVVDMGDTQAKVNGGDLIGQSTSPWAWVSPLSQFYLLHVPPVAVVLPKIDFFSLFAGEGGG